jgi:hypothetical protein
MKVRTVAALLLFGASLAHAQLSLMGADVWTEVGPDKVRAILQEMGFSSTEKVAEKSTFFVFELATYKVSLDSHTGFMELQLALSDKIPVMAMNEWNRTHRFTRAYMDTDGGATLESDLDFTGGVTKGTIQAFIKFFGDALPSFAKAVLDANGGGGSNTARTNDRPPGPGSGGGGQPGGSGVLTILDGRMSVRYDPAKWKQTPTTDGGRFEFTHVRGDGYAVVIAERTNIPTDSIADIAFSNIRKQDPSARMIVKQKRRVGGVDVWFQTVQATIKGIPVTYEGYYYGGPAGTIQVLTYTGRNLIGDYDRDFLEFLNGLRVSY